MPHTIFLVPGYGTQGATAADVAGCFPNGSGFVQYTNRDRLSSPQYLADDVFDGIRRALQTPHDVAESTRHFVEIPQYLLILFGQCAGRRGDPNVQITLSNVNQGL